MGPQGLIVVQPDGRPFAPSTWVHGSVDGVLPREWACELNPAPGVWEWGRLDSVFDFASEYGKTVSLDVAAGRGTPHHWETNDPADPKFQAAWQDLIGRLGRRYASHPKLVQVKLTGANTRTDEIGTPAGDSPTAVAAAIVKFAGWFRTAFPQTQLCAMVTPRDGLAAYMALASLKDSGLGNLAVQDNGCSDAWAWQTLAYYQAEGFATGNQMLRAMDSPLRLQAAAARAKPLGGYLEVYQPDLIYTAPCAWIHQNIRA